MIGLTKTITTTRSEIIAASPSWRTVYLHVIGNGIVYLGDNTVTSTNGMPTEKQAAPFALEVPAGETVWAVVGSGTEDLRILEPTAQ